MPPIEPVSMTFATSNGLTLAADRWGDDKVRPVVLLHGGGQTRHAWGGATSFLAQKGWCAYTVDQRGHGESEWSPDAHYHIDFFAQDMRTSAPHSMRRPPLLAPRWEASPPCWDRARAIRLCCPRWYWSISPRRWSRLASNASSTSCARAETGFADLDDCANYVASYLPHRKRPKDNSGLLKNLCLRDDGRYYWHWEPRFVTDADRRREERDPDRLIAAAKRLTCPTLLVRGGSSDLVTEERAKEFLQYVPHAEFVDVSGAGHMVAGDKNDHFTDSVIGFLERV